MARKKDSNSTRQRAFTRLDELMKIPRSAAVDKLIAEFSIARPYAMTLYQSHRTAEKQAGHYTKVFLIRDMRDGAGVDPYMSSRYVLVAKRNDSKTWKGAVSKYESDQNRKIKLAKRLK